MAGLDQYYVIGHPIDHSLSPEIHTAFAKQTNQAMAYHKHCVLKNDLKQALDKFQAQGVKGLSVTLPFKEEIIGYIDQMDASASLCGAVNTIKFQDNGQIIGFNTDGAGFIDDIVARLGQSLYAKKVLVLGAGGATAAILPAIAEEKPTSITLYNRTHQRAMAQVMRLNMGSKVEVVRKMPQDCIYDIIINATSSSLKSDLPEGLTAKIIHKNTFAYDLAYSTNQLTQFCQFAKQNGAYLVADGIGMLIAQAAAAFYLWRGVQPLQELTLKTTMHNRFGEYFRG